MRKGWKLFFKIIGIIIGVVVLIVGGLAVYISVSPQPAVWLLRNAFGEETQVVNVDNYDEIKKNVIITKDIVYPSQDERNTYDVYLPKDAKGQLPTLVWVHGGAFVAGTKEGIENYAIMLANEGYAVIGVDYQWAPEIQYPGQVRQIEECLTALNDVQDQYHLDLNQIVLVGDSAGAHIAAQATLLATNPDYEKAIGVSSAISSSQLRGSILYCGPYNVSEMFHTGNKTMDFFASRIGWALMGNKDWQDGNMIKTTTIKDYLPQVLPPIFISDGNTGSFESQGKELVQALQLQGHDVTSLFFDHEQYGEVPHEYQMSIGDHKAGTLCYEETLSFLKKVCQKR